MLKYILFVQIISVCLVHGEDVEFEKKVNNDTIELICSLRNIQFSNYQADSYIVLYHWNDVPITGYSAKVGELFSFSLKKNIMKYI